MRSAPLFATVVLFACLSATAEARIAVEPLRRVLRTANDDIRACRARHGLEVGRYTVRLTIDDVGKVDDVAVRRAPVSLDAAARSCLEAAFTRLRFVARVQLPSGATVEGAPRSRLPPMRRGGVIEVSWPFVLTAP